MSELTQPKGIGFFNIKSGETHYARLEAQIQAFINSSDMGINASRDQDFGWRLEPEWVRKVKAFRRNEAKMERLTERNGGQKVTTPQILYAIYGEELRAAQERSDEEETPFEEEYLQQISSKQEPAVESVSEDDLGDNDVDISEPINSTESTTTLSQAQPTTTESNGSADSAEKSSNRKTVGRPKSQAK